MADKQIAFSHDTVSKVNADMSLFILVALFFLSGYTALIYQIIWQRMLFTLFGVDLQSVTIVVSVFMFGLGIGGLVGGYLADQLNHYLLMLYIVVELGVAFFGKCSPWLISALGNHFFSHNELITVIASFVIFTAPTLLMGTTFPLLVTHVNKRHRNIGQSVGTLYFANTLGGASGAYFSGFVLLNFLGMTDIINIAVILNIAIAMVAFIVFRNNKD